MKSKITEEQKDEVKNLVASGTNLSQTAKKTGISLSSVRNIVKASKGKKAKNKAAKVAATPTITAFKDKKEPEFNLRSREGLLRLIGELTVENNVLKMDK